MAISFKDKIAYVNKFADKSDEKLQKVIKLSVNIESPKLNLTDAQKDKIKSSLQTAFERIKKIEDEKGAAKGTGKKLKNPNLLQLAKQIKQKQGVSFEEARKKAKQAFAAKKSGQTNAIQAVLQDFKNKVGKIEYSRATRGTDIKRDMERPALKAGKRKVTTQGSTTNAYGTFKNKVGKVYYESRANRMDVNQPSKKRYPKLEDGGKFGDGGYEPYIYYFYDEDGNEITFRDIEEARSKAKERGVQKFRDDLGGEYFINYGDGGSTSKYAKGGQMSGHFTFLPYKTEGNMYISTKLQGESPDSVMVRGVEGKLKGDDYKSAEYVAMVIMQEHPYVDRLEIIKRGASVMKNKKVAAFIRDNYNKDSYKIEYYADGGFVAVGEKDGYWTIMTKPTTKEKAQKMLDIGFLPKGEIGKVVTVEEAKKHKKVIGREYLADGGKTLAAIAKKYEKNEDENAHSENVVLLAKHFGTAEELKLSLIHI